MWYYPLSGLINGFTLTALGIFVFLKNRKALPNITYAIFCFFISFWSYSYFLWQISKTSKDAFFWCQMLMLGAIFIPAAYFHFITTVLNRYSEKRMKQLVYFAYLLAGIFLIFNFTSLMIIDIRPRLKFPFWPTAGPIYKYFLIYFAIFAIYGCYLLLKEARKTSGTKRNQFIYIFVGSVLGYIGGATNFPLWYDIEIYPVGNILSSIYVALVGYAIIRYRLMNISVAITRTGLFVVVYTLVLGLPFIFTLWAMPWLIGIIGANWWIVPLALMAALATAGPFAYIYLEKRAEAILLREQRRYQETLKQAAVGMTRIRNLDKLLNLIVHIVTRTVRIAHSGIYLFDSEKEQYQLAASRNLKDRQLPILDSKSPLITWIKNQRKPLIYEEVKQMASDERNHLFRETAAQMQALAASVIIPSFLEDRLLGFLILGDKRSRAIYTQEDLDIFWVLATQAALAIENALFILEVKAMHEQIAQAEKMATIGTMADGLSHQINNRLHALAMIAGDTLDTVALTDIENYPEETKVIFRDVKYALERIQANIVQGREIVSGLLKYSRKGEEGLAAVSIHEILEGALEMVKFKIKLSEFELLRDYPPDADRIKANLTQMQEVFFNLIDNAYDAIKERREVLREPGYKGEIKISCRTPQAGFLKIIFSDNGIGVKEADKHKVFTPFFTTKVSSRKGTGLGLFVIRRIVEELHQGRINYESEYAEGTRFTLEMPAAKG